MAEWGFYGRTEPLRELRRVAEAGRWFFCRIEGRRRIGKTTLLGQLARNSDDFGSKLIYMQTPDSDERDVAATFRRSLDESDRNEARALANSVVDFPSMAAAIGELCRAGMVVVLDEFQYFTRSALRHFNSFLQAEVDKLRSAALTRGGIFVLGSLHSDMSALLEDKAAPLYGRITAHHGATETRSLGVRGPHECLPQPGSRKHRSMAHALDLLRGGTEVLPRRLRAAPL